MKLKHDATEINFLNTVIYKVADDRGTRSYGRGFFQVHRQASIHTTSFHPKHTTKGILKSQLIRFKRISLTKKDYNTTCNILFKTLVNRGYTHALMRKQMKNIWFNYTDENNRGDKNKGNVIPIIIHYNTM